jgi:intracellular sulfur oxidation DsrE/DsrF family protein
MKFSFRFGSEAGLFAESATRVGCARTWGTPAPSAKENTMNRRNILGRSVITSFFRVSLIALATSGLSLPAAAQSADTPYGTAKFSAYSDIESVKQLKVVWDFNFIDPKAVGVVFNNLNALFKATAEFGPHEIEPIKVVIVSHGPELVVFAKKNYEKYKEIVDRASSFAKQGVKFEICRNAATAQGFAPEDLHGFVTVVPAGPHALAYWQSKGYTLNAVGATMPTPPISELNKADINKKTN